MAIGTRSRRALPTCGECREQREVARERQRETAFAAPTFGQSTPRWAARHHADAELYPRCSLRLVALLGPFVLSL